MANLPGTEKVAGPSEVPARSIQNLGLESAISSWVVVALAAAAVVAAAVVGSVFGDDQRRDLVPSGHAAVAGERLLPLAAPPTRPQAPPWTP